MPTRLQRLARTVKSLLPSRRSRNTTIRAVPAPIRPIDTWVRITRPRNTTLFWNPLRHTTTFALPEGDISVDDNRHYRMYVFNDAAATARIRSRRNRANPELVETNALQQKNASELAKLKTETDKLKAEYYDLHDRYERVCKHHNLPIEQLEDRCSKCLCSIDGEAMMFPVSIRKQTKKVYERYNITKWFSLGNTSDPNRIEKDELTVADLTPNIDIKDQIEEYKKLMQDTIDNNPLTFDDQELAAGLRGQKTKRKRKRRISRTNRLSRIIRRKRKRRKHKKSIKKNIKEEKKLTDYFNN